MIGLLAPEAEAEVLLMGTYHMANPGRDLINLVADDVLAHHRQKELEDLVARLSKFEPTKICVEVPPESQQDLDKQLAQFLSGELEPRRDEIAQIAFPLARTARLDKVYGINDWTPMRWEGLEAFFSRYAEEDRRFKEYVSRAQVEAGERSRDLAKTTIREFLRDLNEAEALRRNAAFYVDAAGLGSVEEHGGAEMLASWYERNIRIFSNLSGVTTPADRIFVLFGSGHIPILRELIELSSRHRLVDATSYL